MYVIPYLMGPAGSPLSRTGLMVTDSPYVVASMHLMTRVGPVAIQHMRDERDFVAGLHSLGDLSPDRRLILHFPEERLIWSVGSGYGGNALLGKKCHALRIASWQARQEGWLAEHMLILGVEDPQGEVTYLAAAMPSASGKTNLAMMLPPDALGDRYHVSFYGDDIAWLWVDEASGRLYGMNPEFGVFGVAKDTNETTNPTALGSVAPGTGAIFTNVAYNPDTQEVWWEGRTPEPPTTGEASPSAAPGRRRRRSLARAPRPGLAIGRTRVRAPGRGHGPGAQPRRAERVSRGSNARSPAPSTCSARPARPGCSSSTRLAMMSSTRRMVKPDERARPSSAVIVKPAFSRR